MIGHERRFALARQLHQRGRELRKRVPRSAHARTNPDARDPVTLLLLQDRERYAPLLPERYGRMSESPFAFLRGSAGIMAHDLARTPSTGYRVQASGDCHLLNFSVFVTTERRLVFDLNDFDETLAAPWEWDVKRLAASIWVAGRYLGLRESDCRAGALRCVDGYRRSMAHYAGWPALRLWYTPLNAEPIIQLQSRRNLHSVQEVVWRAIHSTARKLPKVASVDGAPRIVDEPPMLYHPKDRERALHTMLEAFDRYRDSLPPERRVLFDRYRLVDVAMKIVGVGSVGRFCAIALFEGELGDALFLQVKQAQRSVLAAHVANGTHLEAGERVVRGQRLMQSASDPFLGWSRVGDPRIEFYVRQLRDVRVNIALDDLTSKGFVTYARFCGVALSHSHARSGEAALISGYLGSSAVFDRAIAEFACAYADQTERDYAAFMEAIASGRVVASTAREP